MEFGLGYGLHFSWHGVHIHNIVTTWSARSLFIPGKRWHVCQPPNDTFSVFVPYGQQLHHCSGAGLVIIQCAPWGATRRGGLHLVLLHKDSGWRVLFGGKSKQKVVGSLFIVRASTRPSRSHYYSGATPRVRLMTPSFSHVTSTYWKLASTMPLLDLPLVGTERHGYPWVPTDQGSKVPVKWTRPARSPADLQVGPETLSTTLKTSDDLIQIPEDLPGLWHKFLP
jgi:hypothetical protein